MRIFAKMIFVLLTIVLIADISASIYFYQVSIARTKKDFLKNDTALKKSVPASAALSISEGPDNDIGWFGQQPYDEVNITSEDGLSLKGYYLKAKTVTSKTAILAHGYSSQGTFMGTFAKIYYDIGYNVLLPDDRGHGKSEGNYIGFGWMDRKDYIKWIDFVIDDVGQDSQIVLHGVSMGGATVLMTSGEDLPTNVKTIVSDCAYTSVKEELKYQLNRMYYLPYFPILNSTSVLTKLKAGYYFEEASTIEQVKKSKTPTLFIHGGADKYVPSYMVNQLYEACNSEKDLLIVPNAGHGTSYNTDFHAYKNKVNEFVGKYIK